MIINSLTNNLYMKFCLEISTMNIEYQETKKEGGQRCWVFNV